MDSDWGKGIDWAAACLTSKTSSLVYWYFSRSQPLEEMILGVEQTKLRSSSKWSECDLKLESSDSTGQLCLGIFSYVHGVETNTIIRGDSKIWTVSLEHIRVPVHLWGYHSTLRPSNLICWLKVNGQLAGNYPRGFQKSQLPIKSPQKSTCIVMCGSFIVKHGAMISQQKIVESLSNCMALKI